jgi:thymidylate synthase
MKQYKDLLKAIKEKGTLKPAARANMPSTTSLFGYQFRHNLQEGFPLLTTKKVNFKAIVIELLWFLRGDTNIKYLVDNGVNIWNQDAYNFYVKKMKEFFPIVTATDLYSFEEFIEAVKNNDGNNFLHSDYNLGDCGYQYGKVWRDWEYVNKFDYAMEHRDVVCSTDQIQNIIEGLKKNPESRRHIVTAIDPAHDNDLALYWCHAMFQFNCRKLTDEEVDNWTKENLDFVLPTKGGICDNGSREEQLKYFNVPEYYLDCQLYQRSADVFLGVPFNIASYALLTHIIAKMCNMIAGDFIHSFGDVHIYENHMDAVDLQLSRIPKELPKLNINSIPFDKYSENRIRLHENDDIDYGVQGNFDFLINSLLPTDFQLVGYDPHPSIKAELSTGLIK